MKKLFFIGILLFPMLLHSQRVVENTVDPFTGKREIWTSGLLLNSPPYYGSEQLFETKFALVNGVISLRFEWVRANWKYELESGNLMLVKLNTGEIFELENQFDEKVATVPSTRTLNLVYHGDISCFGNGLVTHIRIYTTKWYFDFEVKEKKAKKLLKQYQLFQKAVNE